MLALTVLTMRSNRPASYLEGVRVGGREVVVGAEPQPVLLLLQCLREHGDLGAHRVSELDGHVAQPTEADDGDLLAGTGAPATQRGVGGDAGAQQRRRRGRVDAVRNGEDEAGVHDDVGRVAALGDGAVAVGAGVGGHHAVEAVLLVAVAAVGALAAGVDHAADADTVTDPVAGDVGADLGDDTHDLVSRHDGERLGSPVAVDGVDVGVTDPGVLDLDEDVVRADVAAFDDGRGQGLAGGGSGVGVDAHWWIFLFCGCRVWVSVGGCGERRRQG